MKFDETQHSIDISDKRFWLAMALLVTFIGYSILSVN